MPKSKPSKWIVADIIVIFQKLSLLMASPKVFFAFIPMNKVSLMNVNIAISWELDLLS